MPERLHRRADVQNFETDSGEPLQSEGGERRHNEALEERARQFGDALGRAVVTLREARETLKDIAGETQEVAAIRMSKLKNQALGAATRINSMAEDVGGTITQKTRQWSQAATSAADEWRRATKQKTQDIGSQARMGYYRARLRANQVVREYPLHVVMTAGVLGFLLGVGLQIWRSNRE